MAQLHETFYSADRPVKKLSRSSQKTILVTGGAGFVGSHLVDKLIESGHSVIVIDNLFTGSKLNIAHWLNHSNFEFVRHDITEPIQLECSEIFHLACPASPRAYSYNPVKTLKTCFIGTLNVLGIAKRKKASFLLASSSEVYGCADELNHPQVETYHGNVNPVGTRSCYDEGKRSAESLTTGYALQDQVSVRIARIFNCYGPRMDQNDGRVVSNFIVAALKGENLIIYGDGKSTRSLIFIDDLVNGLIDLMGSNYQLPMNLGSEEEKPIQEWAEIIINLVYKMRDSGEIPLIGENKRSDIEYISAVEDDPSRRRANISLAKKEINFNPVWSADAGLRVTIKYFSDQLAI